MKYLITGGCGFLGSNLASEVLKRNGELVILDNLYRYNSEKNLEWLKTQGDLKFIHADIRNYTDVETLMKDVKPDIVFHLAGQVSMITSLGNPRFDFEINILGTHNLLEATRKHSPESIIIYASTNKVYGDLSWVRYKEAKTRYITPNFPKGFPEAIPLDFHTPYGCSKGAADQYVLDSYRTFGIRTAVFRHSSIYGTRQFSTYDQGWLTWFCLKAVEIKKRKWKEPLEISGTGKQVRDVLYIDDAIDLYFTAVENIEKAKGHAFNIGGGIKNSLSLIELFDILSKRINIKIEYKKLPWRQSDQKVFIASLEKVREKLNWVPKIENEKGVEMILSWIGILE